MNGADVFCIVIIGIFTLAGMALGFTRGLGGFVGVFFGAKFATMQAAQEASANNFLGVFIGLMIAGYAVAFMFYGATKFTPIDSMDAVFGAIFGLFTGWGFCYGIFYYYEVYKSDSNFWAMVQDGSFARFIYDLAPWTQFMQRMEPLSDPDPFGERPIKSGD